MARASKRSAKGGGAAKSTVSGPRKGARNSNGDAAMRKANDTQTLAAAFPFNSAKAGEIGEASRRPGAGPTAALPDEEVTSSTVTEATPSAKTGTKARPGLNPANSGLDRVRVDSGGQPLTTNFGQPIADNQKHAEGGAPGTRPLLKAAGSCRRSPRGSG